MSITSKENIHDVMTDVIHSIEDVKWLEGDQKQYFVNTFISDLANRYTHLKALTCPSFSPSQNRTMASVILGKIGKITHEILSACHTKKAKMDEQGVFSKEANVDRVLTYFRIELSKRIDTVQLWRSTVEEVKRGAAFNGGLEAVYKKPDYLTTQVQEVRDFD